MVRRGASRADLCARFALKDTPAAQRWLEEHRIPASARSHRLRLDHERNIDAPAWLFSAEGLEFDVTVLPQDSLRQAPLSGHGQ